MWDGVNWADLCMPPFAQLRVCLIYLQNTSLMFALHHFGLLGVQQTSRIVLHTFRLQSLRLLLWLQHWGKQWICLINDELLCVIHTRCYDTALCLLLLHSKLFWSWWITPAFWGERCTSACISAETFGCKSKRNTPVWSPLLHKKGEKNHSTYKQQQENENLLHA